MTEQTLAAEKPFAEYFIERLAALPRAERAILKRNAGRTLADSRQAVGVFYRLYPREGDGRDEEIFFLVATLYGLNPRAFPGDFGSSMKALVAKGMSPQAVDARMTVLLESRFDMIDGFRPGGGDLAYRLQQCAKLAASHEIGINWPQLIDDLKWWSHPNKRVQKTWARSYFSQTNPES